MVAEDSLDTVREFLLLDDDPAKERERSVEERERGACENALERLLSEDVWRYRLLVLLVRVDDESTETLRTAFEVSSNLAQTFRRRGEKEMDALRSA